MTGRFVSPKRGASRVKLRLALLVLTRPRLSYHFLC